MYSLKVSVGAGFGTEMGMVGIAAIQSIDLIDRQAKTGYAVVDGCHGTMDS
jgi:hypothetical protein